MRARLGKLRLRDPIVSEIATASRLAMEEEKESVISSSGRGEIIEPSDSNSITQPFATSKGARPGPSVPASRFKGVVLQQNGHWGAQIYANHQRIWLGTFRTEREAAMAYDSAAIRVRAGDSYRNFPWTNINIKEPEFQSHLSAEAVLEMIRDGTYPFKFAEYLTPRGRNPEVRETALSMVRVHDDRGMTWKLMFQKELTPSDVGKLNRVVIPKRYALKYFPEISKLAEVKAENGDINGGSDVRDVELVFHDRFMKMWKFRYCYWTSSQSFVLTRGWSRFVKENKLKANDVITFFMCEYKEKLNEELKSICVIDVSEVERNSGLIEKSPKCVGVQYVDLELHLGFNNHVKVEEEEMGVKEEELRGDGGDRKGFKLFGMHII